MRGETYFVRQHSRSTRSHYTVLSATRHHRMVEAATFSANVSLVIGSRNGKTAGRLVNVIEDRPLPPCAILCLEMLEHPAASLFHSRSDVCLAPFRFIRLWTIWSSSSFVHLPIRSTNRSYIHSSSCAIILLHISPRSSSLAFHETFLLSLPLPMFVSVRILTHGFLEKAPLRYYIFRHEWVSAAIFNHARRENFKNLTD